MNNHTAEATHAAHSADEVRALARKILPQGWFADTTTIDVAAMLEAYADLLAVPLDCEVQAISDYCNDRPDELVHPRHIYFLVDHIRTLNQRLAETTESKDKLTDTCGELHVKVARANTEIRTLTRDKEAAEQRANALDLDLGDKIGELGEVGERLEAAERERDELNRSIMDKNEAYARLAAQLQAAEERIAELEGELADEENDRHKRFLYRTQD